MKPLAIAALAAMIPLGAQAGVPPPCSSTAAMMDNLRGKYGEAPLDWRLTDSSVLQLWGQAKGGDVKGIGRSWTMLRHMPNGISCVIAAGKDLPDWATELSGLSL